MVKSAEFVKGIIGTDVILKEKRPHIAFVGRSNVGKSSVINSLVNRKSLVKSSSQPGKTRQINLFLVNNNVYFVDLPGYGFAKTKEKQREKIRRLILWYLTSGEARIKKVVLIIDARVGPTEFDEEMFHLLKRYEYKFVVIANKVDKLKKSELDKQLKLIQEKFGDSEVKFYSAKTKQGRDELLAGLLVYEN